MPARGPVWCVSNRDLLAGDDWLNRIKEELTEASVVILMLSKRSIRDRGSILKLVPDGSRASG